MVMTCLLAVTATRANDASIEYRVKAAFLQGDEVKFEKNKPYRPVLAKWITSPDNPYFARAMVNRVLTRSCSLSFPPFR